MASLKDIRKRISSVTSTRQITSAMKMVSAAKLKKAQDAIIQMRPYADKLNQILVHLSSALDQSEGNLFAEQRATEKVLIVVMSANRGLCGGFNSNVVRGVQSLMAEKYPELWKNKQIDLLMLGKKGAEILKGKGYGTWPQHNDLMEKPSYAKSEVLASQLMEQFSSGEYDRIELVYNQFKNAGSQVMVKEQFLPVEIDSDEDDSAHDPFYIFEPSLEYMIESLIPQALKTQFHKAILDSQAAEHGARMTAMHQATDNATEMIRDLNLEYNKARQAAITSELIEIISGSEALKS